MKCIFHFLNNETAAAPDETDWQELILKAEQQKLLPMVYEVLSESMPEDVRRTCKSRVFSSVGYQTKSTAEFLKTYKELSEAEIKPIVVKGIICKSTYIKPDYRASFDEDLYIVKKEYPAFHKKMLELGYEANEPDYKNDHEQRYIKDSVVIEGHWDFFPKTNDALNALNAHVSDFWDRVCTKEIDGVELRTLEPTDHMIFLLMHTYKHFINSGVGVRQLCDIAQWAKCHELDWKRIHDAMKAMHCECFAAAIFDAGEKYFGMTFPKGWKRADCTALVEDAINGGIYGSVDMSRKHSGSITLGAVESAHNSKKHVMLLKTLFPSRVVMESNYPWSKKCSLLLPAAWVVRIMNYIGTRGQTNSALESIKIGSERVELLKQYKIL